MAAQLGISVPDGRLLVRYGDVLDARRGDVLISGWTRLRWVFFVLAGHLEVATAFDRSPLGPGGAFGVIEALTEPGALAPGSLVAVEHSSVLALPYRSLTALAATTESFGALVGSLVDTATTRSGR